MKALHIIDFFNKLTGVEPKYSGGQNVYVNCPLAKWTHKKGFDSRPSMSVKVNETGQSPAFCWNPECAFKGSLKRLVHTLAEYDNSVYLELFINLFNDYEQYDYTKFIDDFDISFDKVFEGSREHVYDKSLLLRYSKINKPWRCLSKKAVGDFDLRYDPVEKRVLFPVYSSSNELVGCSGRTICGHRIKYKNYWNFQKSKYLYGENFVANNSCVLVEGQYDTIKVYDTCRSLNHDVLGMFGSRLSDNQAKKILTWHNKCIIFTDNDDAGRTAIEQIAKKLYNSLDDLRIVFYRSLNKDPGELTSSEVISHLDSSVSVRSSNW